jgi:hypothetical protein
MTYAENIVRDTAENEYFVLIKPRISTKDLSWTLYSGDTYQCSFPYGPVESVTYPAIPSMFDDSGNGVDYTLGADRNSLSTHQYYFDEDTKTLYICWGVGAIPHTTATPVIITFCLYLSTKECLWYSDPTDSTTATVQWYGCIKQAPTLSMVSDLQNFGYFPFETTTLVCSNDKNIFQQLVYSASFKRATVNCWHQCGTRDTDNIQSFLTGAIDDRVRYSPTQLELQISDLVLTLNDEMEMDTFTVSNFSGLDPDYIGAPIRKVYGLVRGFVPVNVDYNAGSPTTSNNRKWVIGASETGWDSYSATITSSVDTTHFKISDADAKFFRRGDFVVIDKATDQYTTISTITKSGSDTTIGVADSLSGTVAGGTIKKSAVQAVYFYDDSAKTVYLLKYDRDYTETVHASGTFGITLRSTAEANAGAGTFNPSSDKIWIDVSGRQTMPTIGGVDFDNSKNTAATSISNESGFRNTYGSFQRVAIVLYDFLKREFGLDETEIDTQSLLDLDAICQNEVAFAIPQQASGSMPTYKDVIDKLLLSCNSKLYFDSEGKVVVKPIVQISSADTSILKEEMFEGSYELDFTDIAVANIKSDFRERYPFPVETGSVTKILENYWADQDQYRDWDYSTHILHHYNIQLHGITKVVDLETYLAEYNGATAFRWINRDPIFRIYYFQRIYTNRSGKLSFSSRNLLSQNFLGDSVEVTRDDLPGFAPGADNSRNFSVTKLEKNEGSVSTTLDDQKGVQEDTLSV